MANNFQSRFSNTMVAYLTAIAFATTTLTSPPLMGANANIDLGAINFGMKVEKLYEKIKKSINKDKS